MKLEERFSKYLDATPRVDPTAFIASNAILLGDVTVGEEASIWFNAVLRADINKIVIGPRSNIQDGTIVHLADDYGTIVGEYVTVGHAAVIHACTIADEVLVGMGAIIMDGAEVGPRCIIGARALVTAGTKIPEGSLVLGSPAKVVKQLDQKDQANVKSWAAKYVEVSRRYLSSHPELFDPKVLSANR